MGNLKHFLGIEFARSKEGIYVSQRRYILDLLEETRILGCKLSDTLIDHNHKLKINLDGVQIHKRIYERLISKLICLSHIRLDIAFAIGVMSQFMHAPLEDHLEALMRILKYLKATPDMRLLFSKNSHMQVEAYTDADHSGHITDRRSASSYCDFLGGNLVNWRSKKQLAVTRSSAKAEYRAMALGICELMWIRTPRKELQVDVQEPMRLYCDNRTTLNIVHNSVQHDRTNNEVDRHFINENIDNGLICTPFISSKLQLTNTFTKGVSNPSFNSMTCVLGVKNTFELG